LVNVRGSLYMLGLPEDVSRYLMGFLGLRSNWRTCKACEAALIHKEVEARSVEAYYVFHWSDLEEIYTWSLFGVRYILRAQYHGSEESYDWYEDRFHRLYQVS